MSELSRIIAEEIRRKGPISAARFMELALYCPVYGYYERDADRVGRRGDFQTNVSVGSVFGDLLAAQFAAWMDVLKTRGIGKFQLVEAGAHDGRLALDILAWLKRQRPELLPALQYHLLEPSAVRQSWQRAVLEDFLELMRWSPSLDDLRHAKGGFCGVVFSNEFLDALPVHRFGWDRKKRRWFEWRVDVQEGRFVWRRGAAPSRAFSIAIDRIVPPALQAVLPDAYVLEYSPTLVQWWRDAANHLSQGWLLTFDYGFDQNAAILPERTNGTLRGYHHHQMTSDVLSNPGSQDITAHVHFGRLRTTGEECGMRTEFFGEQGRFLSQLMQSLTQTGQCTIAFNPEELRQFKTLIHPDHFGHSFKVLVQSKLP